MRRRLGVVLLLPEPLSSEVRGLRRALGSPSIETQPTHLTLVPPVNVSEGRVLEAVAVLRRAAARCPRSVVLTLGPPATFMPVSPVVYLKVGGNLPALHQLQSDVFTGPLLRTVDYDYVPHVTLHESATDEILSTSTSVLSAYQVEATFERLHLLVQGPDRVWRPMTDVGFGPAVVRGRGGVELHLRWTERPAPDVHELLAVSAPDILADEGSGEPQSIGCLEARDAQDDLIGVRVGTSSVVTDDWLGYGIEDRLLDEPIPP